MKERFKVHTMSSYLLQLFTHLKHEYSTTIEVFLLGASFSNFLPFLSLERIIYMTVLVYLDGDFVFAPVGVKCTIHY